jgi:hypothetical protein
LRGGLIAYGRD